MILQRARKPDLLSAGIMVLSLENFASVINRMFFFNRYKPLISIVIISEKTILR